MAIRFGSIGTTTTQTAVLASGVTPAHRVAVFNPSAVITVHPTGNTSLAFIVPSNTAIDIGVTQLNLCTVGFTAGTVNWWADPA